jgi:glutamyl-tRNA synthetase
MSKTRVRFAPSPTGPLHIGGLRTALFNYLFAKKNNGTFILRIEDTDQTRFVPGAEEYIIDSLKWCGLIPDEGVSFGGDFGPYRQSERKEIYRQYAETLIKKGSAYYAFDTPEELDTIRKDFEARKETFTYDSKLRMSLKNSLTLNECEVMNLINMGIPYVVRFKFPENKNIEMKDLIRGDIVVNSSTLDDKVLYKSDGMPTYHLANVVDDHLMEISHVIRGEEWLPSMPLHVSMFKAFGWQDTMPQYAHLPLILKPDGKGKLSKRDGDKGGFPVFPLSWLDRTSGEVSLGYRESGYFPDACLNIIAFLGWNPGTEQEIFTMEELIENFSLEKTGKAGAKFDPEKAKWFNHQYLQEKSDDELAQLFLPVLLEKNIQAELPYINKVIGLVKERANFVQDIWDHADYFFMAPAAYDSDIVKKRWTPDIPEIMKQFAGVLQGVSNFEAASIEGAVKPWMESKGIQAGKLMNAWRLAMVGTSKGPGLYEMAELLGKQEVLQRIEKAITKLSV